MPRFSPTFLAALGGVALLAACAPANIEEYADRKPQFDVREYMNGNLEAKGTFIHQSGYADPMFKVAMKGYWNGGEGQLVEHFTYDDGHTQDRVWHLHMIDDHHFTGTASDVIGEAEGEQYGDAVHMSYELRITSKDGDTHDMDMDDWLYRIDEHTVINRNEMSKFGVTVGELVIGFEKK